MAFSDHGWRLGGLGLPNHQKNKANTHSTHKIGIKLVHSISAPYLEELIKVTKTNQKVELPQTLNWWMVWFCSKSVWWNTVFPSRVRFPPKPARTYDLTELLCSSTLLRTPLSLLRSSCFWGVNARNCGVYKYRYLYTLYQPNMKECTVCMYIRLYIISKNTNINLCICKYLYMHKFLCIHICLHPKSGKCMQIKALKIR